MGCSRGESWIQYMTTRPRFLASIQTMTSRFHSTSFYSVASTVTGNAMYVRHAVQPTTWSTMPLQRAQHGCRGARHQGAANTRRIPFARRSWWPHTEVDPLAPTLGHRNNKLFIDHHLTLEAAVSISHASVQPCDHHHSPVKYRRVTAYNTIQQGGLNRL